MKLVEKHIIKQSNPLFKELDLLCFKSKNLYNASLYQIRQYFFETGNYLNYNNLQKRFQNEKQPDYYALPTKVSQQIMMIVDRNFKSFFQLNNKFKENPSLTKPNIPRYKDKAKGRNILVYSIQSLYKADLMKGKIRLSGTDIIIPAKIGVRYCQGKSNIAQVRIIHKSTCYVIEIVYEKDIEIKEVNKNIIAGIDIGLNNLATVTSNQLNPFMINGRALKSINQFFNKKRATLMSYVGSKGKRISRGLFRSENGKLINADVNGSGNIIRKAVPNAFADGIEAVVVRPIRINPDKIKVL
jgi:putative transposase